MADADAVEYAYANGGLAPLNESKDAATYGYLNGGFIDPRPESKDGHEMGYENIGYKPPPRDVIQVPQMAWGAAMTPGGPRVLVRPDIAAAEMAYEDIQ
jgi:hypothetical protein